jgi:2',3'-cyclic-nucleotide 2'-phosphodiesterase (5'-nucleotidase family)
MANHAGLTVSRQLAREIPEFDVILSGHTHERTYEPIFEGKVPIVEPGSMGSFLGRLDLLVGPQGGIAGHQFQLIPVRASEFAEDAAEKRIVDAAVAPYRGRMDQVVGRTRTPIARYDVLETSADDLVSDAVREASGADIGTTNGFRYSPPILPGPVTEGQLWSLLPLDARMKMGWVTGKELRAYLEHELELVFSSDAWKLSGGWGPRLSGLTLRFAARAKPGHRLVSVKVHGKEIEDARHYTFAGCERDGEPLDIVCRMEGVHDVKVLSTSIHQALDPYFHAHAVVAPRQDDRARATDLPERVFSQDAVLSGAER